MSNKDNEKYNWWQAAHDHGYGWSHGFQSRGIAPSFLGSDSLPQGIADLHWALHGLQGNMDQLDAKMGTFQDNISKIANGMKDDVIKYLADKLAGSKTPLTTDTGYISKMMTTRTRIFSDSYGPETAMDPRDRIRGLTENYNWIQYTQKNPTCDGEYDKVIDFDFVADHQESDGVDSMYVTKGKIILDKVGLIKRVFVTQKETNIVLWYLLTQTIPSDLGVSYTGAIKRVEYDKDSNLVSEKWLSVNHTPLVILGAFSGDANNETEYVQYISTDYKVYQNIDGVDKEIGQLPNDVIMLIDPVNDIVSDSKQAYIMKYTNDGKLRMPLEGFTLIDTMDTGKVVEKFKIIKFENTNRLFTSFVSISPRTETTLARKFNPDEIMTNEGGYYVELYDDNNTYPNVTHSHIFLLSSTEEVYDLDRFASNIMNYHSDAPSPFSRKRERDYTEFGQITFKSKISRMFPEVSQDFGIRDDVPFTLETDKSKQLERITVWLKEPFILERDISERAVNTRLGYTVVHNSDYVKDVEDTDILSVYRQLDFVNKVPTTRNYLKTLPKYDEAYQLPKYLRYRVVDHSDVERGAGKIEVTYFDEINSVSATIDAPRKEIIGNIKYNENLTEVYNKRTNKFSPSVNSQYLSDLIHSDVIYLEGKDFLDKPYGSKQYVLKNETTGSRVTQRLYTSTTGSSDTNNDSVTFSSSKAEHYSGVPVEEVTFTRTIVNGKVGEWFGNGYITELKYFNIPGSYNTGTLEDGNYFQSANPSHKVFSNIVTRGIDVEGITNNMTHVVYRVTNDIGLSMSYHNIALREDRTDNVGYTSKPYRLLYSKWIPGEYVGNDDYPYPPDANAFDREILRRITHLEARNLEVEDTNSIDLTKTGDWKKIVEGSWNPVTNNWSVPENIIKIKADTKIGSGTKRVTLNGKDYDLPNAIRVTDSGIFAPDYGAIIDDLIRQVTDSNNALKSIVKNLTDSGAWDPNASSDNVKNVSLRGGLKSGINIAYGNINLFGGTPDGDHYIRTNSGQTEDDLAGGI